MKNTLYIVLIACLTTALVTAILTYEAALIEIERKMEVIETNVGVEPMPVLAVSKAVTDIKSRLETLESDTLENKAAVEELKASDSLKSIQILNLMHTEWAGRDSVTLPYTGKGYQILKTDYTSFLVSITESVPTRNGVELSISVTNPSLFNFTDAKFTMVINDRQEVVTQTIMPRFNIVKFLIAPIEESEIENLELHIELNRVGVY